MKISTKLLLGVVAVFSVAQLAHSIDYPDIPGSSQFICVERVKNVFINFVDQFLYTYNSVSSVASSTLGNIIEDVGNSMTNTGVSVVTIFRDAISSGNPNGGVNAAAVVTIIIQAFQSQLAELYDAVTNVAGYLGSSGATIQANLVATITNLYNHLTNLLILISSVNISVEKLVCCFEKIWRIIQTTPFIENFLKAVTNVVSIAEDIASGNPVSSTSISQLDAAATALPGATIDLYNLLVDYIYCSQV